MTTIPWEAISDLFINLMISLAPVGVTICLGIFVWRLWIRVTGLR